MFELHQHLVLSIFINSTSRYEGVWCQGNLRAMKTICVNPLSNVQKTQFHFTKHFLKEKDGQFMK